MTLVRTHAGRLAALLLIPLLQASTTWAAPKIDWQRETPVAANEQIPLADFFRPPLFSDPSINRTGTHVAGVATGGSDRKVLMVYDLNTLKPDTIGFDGTLEVYRVQWLNEKRLMMWLSAQKRWGTALVAADVGRLSLSYPLLQFCGSKLVSVPLNDRLHPLVWNQIDGIGNSGGRDDLGVAQIDTGLDTGRIASSDGMDSSKVREQNLRHILKQYPVPKVGLPYGYIANIAGELEYGITYENGIPQLQRLVGDRWEKCPVDLDQIDVLSNGDEPGQLVVRGEWQTGKPRTLQFMDGATGKLGDVLLQDPGYDFDGWLYRDPVSFRIIGAVYERAGPQVTWFTDTYAKLQKALDGLFPGVVTRIIGSDDAQKRFLVMTFSDRQPPAYSWVDLETRKVSLIKRAAPWIDPARMQPMNVIKFKTRDGRKLDAYLTMPAGASKTNPPPLVVLCHGGPWARDTWGFNGEVQFLASRGYAVLQPNYRGSTGYTWMFPYDDQYDFYKMHQDVTDATKAMIASGLIDKNRIAIAGASFGGYLAGAGVSNEPELYRCAVAIAGVFDWEAQIADSKYFEHASAEFTYLKRHLGDPKANRAKFDAIAPTRHADRIKVPVFVAAGFDDQTVEIDQSKAFVSALSHYNVPHETYFIYDEGHGMARVDDQVELYSRVEAFLAKNLMGASTGGAAKASAP